MFLCGRAFKGYKIKGTKSSDFSLEYTLGKQGVESCANGEKEITDGKECRAALVKLGIPVVDVDDSSTHVCYKDGAGNGHNNDRNGPGAFYVCRKTAGIF